MSKKNNPNACDDCGEEFDDEELSECDGGWYCDDCLDMLLEDGGYDGK